MHLPRLLLPSLYMGLSVKILLLLTAVAVSEIDGSAIVSTAAFPWLLAVTVRVGRTGSPGPGRPLLGLGVGLLTGFAGAASLVGLGFLSPGSPHWVYLPLVFATLGTMLGLPAGFNRSVDRAADQRDSAAPTSRPSLRMIS